MSETHIPIHIPIYGQYDQIKFFFGTIENNQTEFFIRGRLQRTSAKISDFLTLPCPGAFEFTKPPLLGRPRPDFPTIIFKHF